MKKSFWRGETGWLAGILAVMCVTMARAQGPFAVTSPNFIYAVNNLPATGAPGFDVQNSPTLTLQAGNTYTFDMNVSSIHPMAIVTDPTGFPPDSFAYAGATPQDAFTGTVTLTIPATGFPANLYYICDVHGFYGLINVMPPATPPAPPQNIIISLVVGATNVVVTSTGTNTTYALVPQYNSNLVSGTWQAVPSFTNTFSNGTNVTSFGRLEPICGPNVFLRISQQPN